MENIDTKLACKCRFHSHKSWYSSDINCCDRYHDYYLWAKKGRKASRPTKRSRQRNETRARGSEVYASTTVPSQPTRHKTKNHEAYNTPRVQGGENMSTPIRLLLHLLQKKAKAP